MTIKNYGFRVLKHIINCLVVSWDIKHIVNEIIYYFYTTAHFQQLERYSHLFLITYNAESCVVTTLMMPFPPAV